MVISAEEYKNGSNNNILKRIRNASSYCLLSVKEKRKLKFSFDVLRDVFEF